MKIHGFNHKIGTFTSKEGRSYDYDFYECFGTETDREGRQVWRVEKVPSRVVEECGIKDPKMLIGEWQFLFNRYGKIDRIVK